MSERAKKPMREQSLENRALYYLERFSATKQSLRQILLRKLKRYEGDLFDAARANTMIDALSKKLEAARYIDDARFAESRTASLANRGTSSRAIANKLRMKGVSAALIKTSVSALDDDAAARAFAKRKRLGAFRVGETTRERMQKDIAAMARAGFSYAASKRALAGPE